jgi:hypothetical protein
MYYDLLILLTPALLVGAILFMRDARRSKKSATRQKKIVSGAARTGRVEPVVSKSSSRDQGETMEQMRDRIAKSLEAPDALATKPAALTTHGARLEPPLTSPPS